MKRPLALFCLSQITGILVASLVDSYIFVLVSSVVGALIILSLFSNKKPLIYGAMVLFYLVGGVHYLYYTRDNASKFEEYNGMQVEIRGYVWSEPDINNQKISYIIKTEEITLRDGSKNSKKIRGKVLLSKYISDKETIFEHGREITLSGRLRLPKGRTNPGGFDFRRYLSQEGVSATIFALDRNIKPGTKVGGNVLVKAGLFLRTRIVSVINQSLPPQQAGLLNGMLIGLRDGLSEEVQNVFSDSGLTHIMAVSGANIAFIVFPLVFIFKKLRLKKTAANIIIINILLLFTLITGFEPSVVRAVIMAIVILVGQIINRETDVYTSLAFAAMVMLFINPCTLFNIGFQLSFAATISLVMFYGYIKQKLDFKFLPEAVSDVLAGTLAAQLGVLPVTVFYFNKVSIVSILANILVVPVLELITILGSLMAILGQIHILISKLIGLVNCTLLSFVLFVSNTCAKFPLAVLKLTTPSLILIPFYYLLIVFIFWYKPKHNIKLNMKHYAFTFALLIAIVAANIIIPKGMDVVILDVGQGDSSVIKTASGRTVLIDGGGANMGESVVIPFLLDYGIERLDLVIASHGHDDHIQGLFSVLKEVEVGSLLVPDVPLDEEFSKLAALAREKGVKVEGCSKGDVIKLDDRTFFKVLHPDGESYIEKSPINNNSLVLKLHFKEASVLFTGDIEKEAEELLLAKGVDLSTDILKVAHHGSSTSSTPEFIDSSSPYAGIISVGSSNNFGHPSSEVIELYKSKNIKIFRTDQDGAVVIKTFGKDIKLEKVGG